MRLDKEIRQWEMNTISGFDSAKVGSSALIAGLRRNLKAEIAYWLQLQSAAVFNDFRKFFDTLDIEVLVKNAIELGRCKKEPESAAQLYMYVHMCAYMYIYIYVYVCPYSYVYAKVYHMQMHTHMHVHEHMYMYRCMYRYRCLFYTFLPLQSIDPEHLPRPVSTISLDFRLSSLLIQSTPPDPYSWYLCIFQNTTSPGLGFPKH